MITPKEAYELFIEKYPAARGKTLVEWDDFYSCEGCEYGDAVDDVWKIDKKTGTVAYWRFDEYMSDLQNHKIIKEYSVPLPTYMTAFMKALVNQYGGESVNN